MESLVDIKTAQKILGERRVYSGPRVAKVWRIKLRGLPILYTEADLKEAARENAAGTADWRLVAVLGRWNLRDLYTKIAPKYSCCHCDPDKKWWQENTEDAWATRKPIAGNYLLDFVGKWGSMSWDNQTVEITTSGSDYERADEIALTEALATISMLTGDLPLKESHHWGNILDSNGYRVCVGFFDGDGNVDINHDRPTCDHYGNLLVIRFRKFRGAQPLLRDEKRRG